MPVAVDKGKKRAYVQDLTSFSSSAPVQAEVPKVKKPKRAETRSCPICNEPIPLRLLARHSELESERVEIIIKQVGSMELIHEDIDDSPGPSSRSSRLSAVKARKSLGINAGNNSESLQQAGRTIQTIIRHRKQRHVKFRDMSREEETNKRNPKAVSQAVCPVCMIPISGDQDMIDVHVDSCLERERLERERRQASEQGVTEGLILGETFNVAGHSGNVRGSGFHTRNRNDEDIDDELDVDGDEEFGAMQFTEGDVLAHLPHMQVSEDLEVTIDGDDEGGQHREHYLRKLMAGGKIVRDTHKERADRREKTRVAEYKDGIDIAVLAAQKEGDESSLIIALEEKIRQLEGIPTPLLCRICIDQYKEPTTSTGCWHTFCRECWLRCLGSTRLCPNCKRITGASDLRRIYL